MTPTQLHELQRLIANTLKADDHRESVGQARHYDRSILSYVYHWAIDLDYRIRRDSRKRRKSSINHDYYEQLDQKRTAAQAEERRMIETLCDNE